MSALVPFWARIPWGVKQALGIVLVVAIIVLLAKNWGRAEEREEQADAVERVNDATETGQQKLDEAGAAAARDITEAVRASRATAKRATDDIRKLPGADAPLDPRVVRRWRDGVCELRRQTRDAGPECPAAASGGEPEGALSPRAFAAR